MDKTEDTVKDGLKNTEYMNFEVQAMNSIDRMICNSMVNFMMISMYRNSNPMQKIDMEELFALLRKDVIEVHQEKANILVELGEEQKKKYNNAVIDTVNNALKLVDKEIHRHKVLNG